MSEVETLLQSIQKTAEELKEAQQFPWWTLPVFTTERAMEFCGIKKPTTFYTRMKEWKIKQCSPGHWPKRKLMRAMNEMQRLEFSSKRGSKSA